MRSPKLHQRQRINSSERRKLQQEGAKTSGEIFEMNANSSNIVTKITTKANSKESVSNIFSLSNRSSNNRLKHKTQRSFTLSRQKINSCSSSQNKTFRASSYEPFKLSKNHLSQELKKLSPLTAENVLDDAFENNLQNINFYSQFKASVQQRKSLLFLKPYVKSGFFHQKDANVKLLEGMEKLKSELYKCIHSSQEIYAKLEIEEDQTPTIKQSHPITNRSAIQYLTEYEGNQEISSRNDKRNKVVSQHGCRTRNKQTSLTVLREKLKSRYKNSNYVSKMDKVKAGEEAISSMG